MYIRYDLWHELKRCAGIYFANDGAGSAIVFPGEENDGAKQGYTSTGCDWMKTVNPVTNEGDIGTHILTVAVSLRHATVLCDLDTVAYDLGLNPSHHTWSDRVWRLTSWYVHPWEFSGRPVYF